MTQTMREDEVGKDLAGMLLTKALNDAMRPVLDELATVRKQTLPALRAISDIYKRIEEIKELAAVQRDAFYATSRATMLEKENQRLREKLKSIGKVAANGIDMPSDDD